jgi:hypothetical protein
MQVNTDSKLTKVRAVALKNGITRYVGYFADGTVAPLRESTRDNFVSCCQLLHPGQPAREAHDGYPALRAYAPQIEFVFSGKPGTAGLGRNQRKVLITCVAIGLDTSVLH